MQELTFEQVEEVSGGKSAGSVAKAAGKVLVRVGHPAAVALGVVLIVGGIAAGYMEAHESEQ
ncbi:hypothetical protein ACO1PK_04695 [Alishewanella sp. d11]|uniref:hypothetical protein n=1 Tax=Alishewanella sp. d11 TaxID=3414030 RepID=UPI003BF8D668